MDMKDKVAIVTGSSSISGIGGATAQLLASRGVRVAVNYATSREGADEVVAACRAAGGDAIAVQGDVASDDDCRRMVDETVAAWGGLDILVNNAATTKAIPHIDMEALDQAEWDRVLGVNLFGTYQMSRAAHPHLRDSGDGSIVNISSLGALNGNGSSIAYLASKGAINTMTIAMARAMAPEVRVNALCPGNLLGNWSKRLFGDEDYARRVAAQEALPLRTAIWPSDVAEAVLTLIEHQPRTTGEVIRLDAGAHLLTR